MSTVVASLQVKKELRLRIPEGYARMRARQNMPRLVLCLIIVETVEVLIETYVTHLHRWSLSFIWPFLVFNNNPWISLSSKSWVYSITHEGIYLKDETNFLLGKGYPVLLWKDVESLAISSCLKNEWPTIALTYTRRKRLGSRTLLLHYVVDKDHPLVETIERIESISGIENRILIEE